MEIEAGLADARSGGWRRVRIGEVGEFANQRLTAAWRVDVPGAVHEHPVVDQLVIGISPSFPFAEPVVIALQARGGAGPYWPHINPSDGVMCIGRHRYSSPPATRILSALDDALQVLCMQQTERDAEHRREFLSYWSQLATPSKKLYLSLLGSGRASRDIVFHRDKQGGTLFAEDQDALSDWMKRVGERPPLVQRTTRIVWLNSPLVPADFPTTGGEVLTLAGAGALNAHVRPGQILPVVLGCEVDGISTYVCAEIEGISAQGAAKGFRPSRPRPQSLIAASFQARPCVRRDVCRADYAFVHGRGRNSDVETLRGKRVAIIGCGALGGFLARALAQAGVGSLLLVDGDELMPSNVGRHLLGMDAIGLPKSFALAKRLEADFPHAGKFDAWRGVIQAATPEQSAELGACDLVIAAGINMIGERAIAAWRAGQDAPPPLLWTWIEEFAVAGHAVSLVGEAAMLDALDEDGAFRMRLSSNWPAGAHMFEAGCGVAYQPYSAADMMGTVNTAHRLALDLLHGQVTGSTVRSWLGGRHQALAKGATLDGAFDRSYAEIERRWPWEA